MIQQKKIGELSFDTNAFTYVSGDNYVVIDSRTHLVEGLNKNFEKTGNLYNKYITSGDFFDALVGRSTLVVSNSAPFYKM